MPKSARFPQLDCKEAWEFLIPPPVPLRGRRTGAGARFTSAALIAQKARDEPHAPGRAQNARPSPAAFVPGQLRADPAARVVSKLLPETFLFRNLKSMVIY
jgi:hypothetical protein